MFAPSSGGPRVRFSAAGLRRETKNASVVVVVVVVRCSAARCSGHTHTHSSSNTLWASLLYSWIVCSSGRYRFTFFSSSATNIASAPPPLVQTTMPPKKERSRKKKDPNAPKRALSAYMFFANAQRDIVRAENPGIAFGQIGKLLGEKWKSMDAEKREPYENKAEADKKRYELEKADYLKRKENEYLEKHEA